uniref:Putative secreted protein n=2 Tax=Nyssorhynchus TaxID=44543 RepID=A0A2M4B5A5_9DIPT
MKNFFKSSALFLRFFSNTCWSCSSSPAPCSCCSTSPSASAASSSAIMFSLSIEISTVGARFLKSSCEDTRLMTSAQFGRCSSLFERISFRSWLIEDVLSWRSLRFRQFCHSDELIRLGRY